MTTGLGLYFVGKRHFTLLHTSTPMLYPSAGYLYLRHPNLHTQWPLPAMLRGASKLVHSIHWSARSVWHSTHP